MGTRRFLCLRLLMWDKDLCGASCLSMVTKAFVHDELGSQVLMSVFDAWIHPGVLILVWKTDVISILVANQSTVDYFESFALVFAFIAEREPYRLCPCR